MDTPARILVADDDKFMHAILADLLTGAGHTVLSAWDGEEALAVARAESPDLILLDIMMPKRNGIQVAQDLKAKAPTRDIGSARFKVARFHQVLDDDRQGPAAQSCGRDRRVRRRPELAAPASPSDIPRAGGAPTTPA